LRGIFRIFFRVRVYGLENVPRKPAMICANHLGWADPFLMLLFFPSRPRSYVLGLHPSTVSDFRAWVVDTLQVIVPLDPAKPLQALRTSQEVLEGGASVVIFPEGTAVGGEEGKLQKMHHGASHLSVTTGIPIVPVGITGTSELWLRRTLTIRVGRPFYPGGPGGDTRTRIHETTERLEKELSALLPGDRERARFKPLRGWLTKLFF
jgi:1-acyl-sn-glycerol-3-phosphate acyltransferase